MALTISVVVVAFHNATLAVNHRTYAAKVVSDEETISRMGQQRLQAVGGLQVATPGKDLVKEAVPENSVAGVVRGGFFAGAQNDRGGRSE